MSLSFALSHVLSVAPMLSQTTEINPIYYSLMLSSWTHKFCI